MSRQSNAELTKMFTGDIQDVVLYCAKKVNEMKLWKVGEMNLEEGRIVCLNTVGWASSLATKDNVYTITLSFNKTPNGVECLGAISNPQGNTFLTRPLDKVKLRKFLEKL